MTSDIAKAMLAIVADRPFHIRFGGPFALQYADDVARMFIACARSGHQGAATCNLRNDVTDAAAFVGMLTSKFPAAKLTFEAGNILPFPADLDDGGLRAIIRQVPHTSLEAATDETVALFSELVAQDKIDLAQLEN
ncbi:MAG: hypothetical protein HC802_18655 [Caldilineaceae bacterium]|nr:hypothetical protein [Caldilineaceae bacterium]